MRVSASSIASTSVVQRTHRRLEARLATSEWLAGDDYTLADICNFAIANGMQFGFPELVNDSETPNLLRWIKQINERPAARRMYEEVPMERLSSRK